MKRLCLLLLCFLCLPLAVNAMAYSETFEIGDEVIVDLYGTGEEVAFNVIKESKAGEKTVRLIFDGAFNNINGTYDEDGPDHTATTQLTVGTYIYDKLLERVGEKHWNYEEIGLLTKEDLTNLGIVNNEITSARNWLAPIKTEKTGEAELLPYDYNYWTEIPVENAEKQVYCVKYNESRTDGNGIYANLVATNITPSSETKTTDGCAIRPVIVVDKSIILCNNTPHTPPTTIPPTTKEKPTPKESPETGITDYLLPLSLVIIFAGSALVIANRKNAFKKF